jgi:hypothetical protein
VTQFHSLDTRRQQATVESIVTHPPMTRIHKDKTLNQMNKRQVAKRFFFVAILFTKEMVGRGGRQNKGGNPISRSSSSRV